MPQQKQEKVVNTFVRGLITEAGELTFPADASIDELNCDLKRDGSRRRRQGVAFEANHTLSSFTVTTQFAFNTGTWVNVGGQSGLEFLVVQNGTTLYFYNKSIRPYSGNEESHTVDLTAYETATGGGAGVSKCSFTSIKGTLVVASDSIETIYITRDNVTETLTVAQISFRVRDFEWQSPVSDFNTAIKPASDERQYDTYNAGWFGNGAAALTTYKAANTQKWPPLTHPWYSGKNSSGAFSASEWVNVGSGTSITGNGLFILDFFNKDRATASGIASLPTEVEQSRFSTVATYAGRVFYAGLNSKENSGTILFSQIIRNLNEFGECLQQNDPTSEYLSDLIDTDGGTIIIPDAVGIQKLHAYDSYLFVFASNGVWQISGVDDIFRATGYSVVKVSEVGLQERDSFISVEGVPFWWSKYGIHTVSFDQVSGKAREENISLGTIQSYWDSIPLASKTKVKSVYDKINKRIMWLYPSENELTLNKLNEVLVLDIALQAFYPWTVGDEVTNTSYIIDASFYSGFGADLLADDVIVNGDQVQVNADDVVISTLTDYNTGDTAIVLLVVDGATGKMTMAEFSDDSFLDWGTKNYSSYAVAGYDFMDSLERRKTLPYITVFCRRTETNWVGDDTVGYSPENPSSLYVSAFWDFKSTASSAAQQAYRLKSPPVPPGTLSSFDYPSSVIATRLKLRGRGRSMRLKFESEQGKDFVLLGHGMIQGVNTNF